MKFYNILIKYRFWLGLLAIALAVTVNIISGFWPSFILYFNTNSLINLFPTNLFTFSIIVSFT